MITGRVKQIETMGLVDGPGIRVVIFMQGCSLRCLFCHNPEMWEKDASNEYTPNQILDIILKYKNYFQDNGGVTFSGGEPLFQPQFLLECLKLCKEHNIHTCLDTSGVGNSSYFREILKYVDLVIYDIKALDEEHYKKMTGASINQSLSFLSVCQEYDKKMWIRQVIVPGINDNEEYIKELGQYIKNIKNVDRVELLPYHTMGIEKYKKLNLDYVLKNVKAMDSSICKDFEKELIDLIK